jgi:uncharacterized protein (TIGR03067 family)
MSVLSTESETLHDVLAREEADRLQGDWLYLAGLRAADVSFSGDRFVVRFHNGEVFNGTFVLTPLHHPRAIDLTIQEGPRHVGKVSLGIYQVDGKRMVLCPGVPGTGERPRYFPPADDRERLSLTLKRAPK